MNTVQTANKLNLIPDLSIFFMSVGYRVHTKKVENLKWIFLVRF
eukprot:SAG11_NODE_42091_length_185_cov_11.732558_1_plen_43_part_10